MPFYIVSDSSLDWRLVFIQAIKHGFEICNCIICRYSKPSYNGKTICCLYKKCGTLKYPQITQAKICEYYSFLDSTDEFDMDLIHYSIIRK